MLYTVQACPCNTLELVLRHRWIGCLHNQHHFFCCGALLRLYSRAPIYEDGNLSWTFLRHLDTPVVSPNDPLCCAKLP